MEIRDVETFLSYYERIRRRTLRVIDCAPRDKLEWTYKSGKFTLGDLIRHIAAIERHMYAETVAGRPSYYNGCGIELSEGYEQTLEFFNLMHEETIAIIRGLGNERLNEKCLTPMGTPITVWKWLRAMVEHEIHHRGQIYMYLAAMDVVTPPLFGLTAEEVEEYGRQARN